MQRLPQLPRNNWQERVEELGMLYHTINGEPYWDESACYRFTSAEIDMLDDTTAELHEMCIAAAESIIRDNRFSELKIPSEWVPYIVSSWDNDEPSVYGRFDLCYDGVNPPKLLEYNADTPTALLEASVVQWFWLKDVQPGADQFNSIHEKLIAFWEGGAIGTDQLVHFSCVRDHAEDLGNVEYLRDTAIQGGVATRPLYVEDIGWTAENSCFVDNYNERITTLFKLYPWEWLVSEEFGPHLKDTQMRLLEPAWKMLLSNKALLPILWQLNEGHPNLLEATFDEGVLRNNYVRKPLFSREGANIKLCRGGRITESTGDYGEEGYIFQRYAPLPQFDGNYPVIGSWIIAGEPAGIGIREDKSEITTDRSRFVPHFFS
jgi:glutathionylspermidine synthase